MDIEKDEKKKKKKRSRLAVSNTRTGLVVAQRKVRMLGGSYYIGVPREFIEKHSLNVGDVLAVVVDEELLTVLPLRSRGQVKDAISDLKG